jgi:hypothetical protein
LGHPRAEWILLPRRAAAFWEGTNAVEGGTGKVEAAKVPGAGIMPKPSYIRECQEKHLPLGPVPKDFSFSLGIQPK